MIQKRPEPLEGEIVSPLERAWLEMRGWLRFKDALRESRDHSESTLGSRILQAAIVVVMLGIPIAAIAVMALRFLF